MDELGQWIVDHPKVVGALLAVVHGVLAYKLFRLGFCAGAVRGVKAEAARVASEALGG